MTTDLKGVKWGDLPLETQDFFLRNNMLFDNIKEGEVILNLTDNLCIKGCIEYLNTEKIDFNLLIDDNSIIYNPKEGILVELYYKEKKSFILKDVLTANEASKILKIPETTIIYAIKSMKLIPGLEFRKEGELTLITKDTLNKLSCNIDKLLNIKTGLSYDELFEYIINDVNYTYNVELCLKNFLTNMSELWKEEDIFYMTKDSEHFLIRTHLDIINENTEEEEVIYSYDVEKIK